MNLPEKRQVIIDVVTSLNRLKNACLEIRDMEYVGQSLRVVIKFNKAKEYYYQEGCTFHFSDKWFEKDYIPSHASGVDYSNLNIPESFDEKQVAVTRIAYYIWHIYLEHC